MTAWRYRRRAADAAWACVVLLGALSSPVRAGGEGVAPVPVVIDYFYEPGCPDCERVRQEVLPAVRERFGGFYVLNHFDVGVRSNVVTLAAYQQALGVTKNEAVCMVLDRRHVLNGIAAIRRSLVNRIDECLAERQSPGWTPAPRTAGATTRAEGDAVLDQCVRGFTWPVVMASGLIDGLNPCAVSTLVFLMSLLSVSKVRARGLLVMGASFCVASFVAYTALGFGLLRGLHLLEEFGLLRMGFELGVVAVLLVLAALSFLDALRFRATGDPRSVMLKLPGGIKRGIQSVMHRGLKGHHLVAGGFFVGAVVTLFESVCTGQVYVPTLVMVIKSGGDTMRAAWPLLLLYNVMFVAPLVAAFVLAYEGLRMETFLAWSRRNVTVSKILLGILFIVLAGLVLVL